MISREKIKQCAWGSGELLNNLVEAYSLWCGLIIARAQENKELMVFGDSTIIIQVALNHSTPGVTKL
jgi:hypothetical protein